MTDQAPGKATRKPEVVDFYRVTDENMQAIGEHSRGYRDVEIYIKDVELSSIDIDKTIKILVISTPSGTEYATRGDYVVVSNGAYRVLSGEEFHNEYTENHKPTYRAGGGVPRRFTGVGGGAVSVQPEDTEQVLQNLGFEFDDKKKEDGQ